MAKKFTKKDDIAPREIDPNKKPNIKLYDEYEEVLKKEGDLWLLQGWFGDQEYEIPVRTKYRFGAVHARYRLLLKSERDVADPNTGQIFPGENRAAQFADGRFDTRDLFDVRGIYRSEAFRAGRIWDQDYEEKKQRESTYQGMKHMLLKDKEFKERFLAEIKEIQDQEAEDKQAEG